MTRAFSYTRFSTAEQSEGTSKQRQDAMVQAWLNANPEYEFDISLTFHDAGVSAFRGKNAKKGKLSAFLRLIEQGRITTGDALLVEEWSRFSRQNPYDGAPVSRQIFDAGVGIVDLRNNIRYDSTTMRDQVIRIRLDLEWERAHRESEEKSIRMQSAWAHKREKATQGVAMTATCPAWLKLVNGRYVEDPYRAATIHLIFEMKAAGIGSGTIARRLNADPHAWHPEPHAKNRTGGWWQSYIEKIIRSRSVIGEFTSPKMSEPIEGYFPAVVDKDLFNRVAARIATNESVPGHGASNINGAIRNIFGGVTRCGRCGGTMGFVNKGRRRPTSPGPSLYLICEKARRGLRCSRTMIRYDRLEGLLLHLVRGLDVRDLLSDETERAGEVLRRQAIEGELAHIAKEVNNLAESIARTESVAVRQVLETKLNEKLVRKAELQQEVAEVLGARREPNAEAIAQHLQSIEDLIQKMQELQGTERSNLRRRLRSALHELIQQLDIEPGEHELKLRLTFRDGVYLSLVLDAKSALRLADDGQRLYSFDEHGNIIDVDPVAVQSTEAERTERQRKVNALVAKALKRQRVSDHMAL